MSDCCEPNVSAPRQASCPITGTSGTRVRPQTVKAILKDSSLRRFRPATYYFCPEPTCNVVYFSQQGELYSKDDVRTTVWQKEPVGLCRPPVAVLLLRGKRANDRVGD
jgi:Zinc binding domain